MDQETSRVGLSSVLALFYGGGFLILIAQVFCIYHAMKNGKPYHWIWLILFFSLIGIALYFLVEIRPTLGKINWQAIRWRLMSPEKKIQARRERLDDSPTIKNRFLLADELMRVYRCSEAATVLQEGLQGAFATDAELMLRVVEAKQDSGQFEAAHELLNRITPTQAPEYQLRYRTALARAWSRANQDVEAEAEFRKLMEQQKSERPAVYYAEWLLQQDKSADARQVLHAVIQRYRRGNNVWRFHEQRWYRLAVKLLKSTTAGRNNNLPSENPNR